MESGLLEIIGSKEYRLLCLMQKLQETTRDGLIIRKCQTEIAEEYGKTEKLGKTKTSVGKMLRRLIKTDCLEPYKIKSGYIITAKGQFVISYIKLLDQYSGGKNNGR